MNALSLEKINTLSPYHVTLIENGDFLFTTDTGVDYSIGFMPDMQIANSDSYQFFINRLSSEYLGHDSAVKETIMVVVDEFFRVNNDIMLYICDTHDGREDARNRLFIRWFKERDVLDLFTIKTADAMVDGQHFYTAIIVQNTHPNLLNITKEFDLLADNLTNK